MPNPRKQIILNEILFWKQNKLLPEHYCDFLMTLYSEGNDLELEEELSPKKAVKAKEKKNNILFSSILIVSSILLLIGLFISKQFVGIIAIFVGIVAIFLLVSSFLFSKKQAIIAPILHIAAALLLLGLSVKVSIEYFPTNQIILYILLIANCIIWLFSGIRLKLMYFTVSGALGIIILIGYQFFMIF